MLYAIYFHVYSDSYLCVHAYIRDGIYILTRDLNISAVFFLVRLMESFQHGAFVSMLDLSYSSNFCNHNLCHDLKQNRTDCVAVEVSINI